ncbi:MAG: universal stress protein [Anaerolineae bacterium]
MYTKILVPLDGSELAEKVLPHVEEVAHCTDAEIVLLRVPVYAYEAAVGADGPFLPSFPLPDVRGEALKEAVDYLHKVKGELALRGLRVSAMVKEGNVAEVIIAFAREAGVDLIAMSTHARTGLNRVVFGSVAEQVLHEAQKPVLLIRPEL